VVVQCFNIVLLTTFLTFFCFLHSSLWHMSILLVFCVWKHFSKKGCEIKPQLHDVWVFSHVSAFCSVLYKYQRRGISLFTATSSAFRSYILCARSSLMKPQILFITICLSVLCRLYLRWRLPFCLSSVPDTKSQSQLETQDVTWGWGLPIIYSLNVESFVKV